MDGFSSFAKNVYWSLLDHAKQSATDTLETTSKKLIQKTAEATGDLTGNNISDKVMKVSRGSLQNNSEIITSDYGKEIAKKRYISPKERQNKYY